MKVGIIAPVSCLKDYCITDIQYCLPSLLTQNPTYRRFYLQAQNNSLIILDPVKVGWERIPEEYNIIQEALDLLEEPLVITPSYMYNWNKTVKEAEEFLKAFGPSLVAGCVEGTTREEVLDCTEELKRLGITSIAIPSHMYRTCKEIPHNGPTIYIENHLNSEELDGLDGTLVTSLPVKLGLLGRLNSDYLPSPNSLTFQEENKFPAVVERNIREIIKFYEG